MKKLIALLFLTLPVFAQVTVENDICSVPVQGGTQQWSCQFIPDVTPLPPVGFSEVVAFGDSYADDSWEFGGQLADLLGIPTSNPANSGDTSSEVLQQVINETAQGIDPNALYVIWFVGNDIRISQNLPVVIAQLRANTFAMLERLYSTGATNVLILSAPDGDIYPDATGSTGIFARTFTDGMNSAFNDAAATYGFDVFPARELIGSMCSSNPSCWSDGVHFREFVHTAIAEQIQASL